MKHLTTVLLTLCIYALPLAAQQIEYVDDEECGCELVFVDGIQTTTDGEFYGFRLADGTVIVPNIYRFVDNFQGNYCKVYRDYGQCGLIDRDGNEIVPCIYDEVGYPSDGRIKIQKDKLYGYLDMQGNMVVEPQYISAGDFSEATAPVMLLVDSFFTSCTFIDTLGKQLFPPIYENLLPFNEGYAIVMRYGRWGMIDHTGREVLPTRYEQITANQDGLFFAGDPDGWALFDYSFKPLTPFIYTWTSGLHNGRIGVMRDGHYGFLDREGNEVIDCSYDETGIFRLGRTMAVRDGHYGIIDTTGDIILPLEYDNNTPNGRKYMYFDSLALVERDGKLGYVDLDGKLVIPFYFEKAFQFSQGLASTCFQGRWGYINTHGDIYIPHVFDIASPFEWGRAEVVYNGNVSKIDITGKCVKNCKGIIAWRSPKQ